MPAKKDPPLTSEERARRIRKLAEQSGASTDMEDFDRAFGDVVKPDQQAERLAARGVKTVNKP